ncbi:MarR family winged helix-turn-helix transcriptional regulator [Lysinibacillus odysseyi]|uniref:RNA polymerase sigma factor n=1 Tax=Lysinibacillus odysseyi 34hs-1 = NBRC 100172 TaxID=1220589 RepID=A0A0A3IM26_9BACI|nr:MarR family transcriptional regulator [Lysinibacillus odysseyi]KGR85819.1 RNA polymerase sigma factor [Lysinibacillus odysseyi 34hs-1 = NBRC 100172]
MDQKRKDNLTALFESISVLERKVANEWNSHNELGFSKSHILILEFLAKEGPKRPSAIADRLKVTTGGVTVLTTKLLKGGFIEKTQNENDRRASQISITEEGLQVLEDSRKQIEALIDHLFGMLTEEEITTLHKIFYKMHS